jgi:cation diffusion facilitator family transporter
VGLFIVLNSSLLSKKPPNFRFSYGYDRYEVLLGFSLGIFMLFVSLFIYWEAFERLFESVDPGFSSSTLIFLALLQLLLNLAGYTFFKRYAQSRAVKESRYSREEGNSILQHITVDAVGTALIVASAWISSNASAWTLFDSVVAGLIMGAVLKREVIPSCQEGGRQLLQTTPASIRDGLEKCLREASTVEGVLELKGEHFWTQAPGLFVGSLHARVRQDANEQQVLAKISNIFSHLVTHLTVQIDKDDWLLKGNGT